jgi:hypothetical protein
MRLFEPDTLITCTQNEFLNLAVSIKNFCLLTQAFKSYNQDSPTVTLLAQKIHHLNIKSKAFASIKVKISPVMRKTL